MTPQQNLFPTSELTWAQQQAIARQWIAKFKAMLAAGRTK